MNVVVAADVARARSAVCDEACAPFADSLRRGQPVAVSSVLSIADGIAVKRPGELTLGLVARWLDDIVAVGEDEIAEAMVLLMEHSKLVVEGAGAVGVAALLEGLVAPAQGGTTVVVLSGGNVDAGLLAAVARRHETQVGRRLVLFTRVPDRPGALAGLLACVARAGANLVEVEHVREGVDLHVRETGVQLVLGPVGASTPSKYSTAIADDGYVRGSSIDRPRRQHRRVVGDERPCRCRGRIPPPNVDRGGTSASRAR